MGRLLRKKPVNRVRRKEPEGDRLRQNLESEGANAHRMPVPDVPAPKKSPSRPLVGKPHREFFWDKGVQFLREVRVELKKVTWPSRKQTMGSTAVVIVLVIIISFFLGLADVGLNRLIRIVLN